MTVDERIVFDLEDVLAIRLVCACGATLTSSSPANFNFAGEAIACSSCGKAFDRVKDSAVEWWRAPSALANALKDVATTAKVPASKAPYRIRLEIARPAPVAQKG